jgi:hypothetical protein
MTKKEKRSSTISNKSSLSGDGLKPEGETDSGLQAEKVEGLVNEYNEAKEDKENTGKAYRTKYKRQKEEQAQKEEALKMFSGFGAKFMDMIVKRLPIPTPLDTKETEQINMLFDNVAVKYIPLLGKYQEETALITCILFIVLPRTNILNQKKISDKEPGNDLSGLDKVFNNESQQK